ncbi:MAG: indole-3-glycerol phosphate synthase TrpC [Gemmatimonadaceae bacterium]
MQDSTVWTPPAGVLGDILREADSRVSRLRPDTARFRDALSRCSVPPSMAAALRRTDVAVVAEVKRRSPSAGTISARLSAAEQARQYQQGGAAAISVLTEPIYFEGTVEDLQAAHSAVSLPLLRKDFHVDPVQLLETRVAGAAAVLLIARALPPDALRALAVAASELSLEIVVEVRSAAELELAIAVDAPMIGINSRDLETLEVDPRVSEALLPLVPSDRVAIAESGIRSRADVERLAAAGADAVLIGSLLSAAARPADLLRSLTTVPRRGARNG